MYRTVLVHTGTRTPPLLLKEYLTNAGFLSVPYYCLIKIDVDMVHGQLRQNFMKG